MTKIRITNWKRSREQAYEVLKRHNIQDFPINILEIIGTYKDIKVLTYEQFALKQELTLDEVIQINCSTDGSIHYHADKEKYVIIYNDKVKSPERIYWTLAHEFGHYILNHHKETNRSMISRNDLSDAEYDLYEFEADFFTRYLINPPSIIREWNTVDIHRVVGFFKVSYKAAKNSVAYLHKLSKNGRVLSAPDDIKKQLSKFIDYVNKGKTCTKCNSFFVIEGSNYCPACGHDDFHVRNKGEDFEMILPGIKVDNKGRALTCPKCENEDLNYDGNHCSSCGIYLVNECSKIHNERGYLEVDSCGKTLNGNARYCVGCGNPSTFYDMGILDAWNQEELDEQREAEEFSDIPF